MGNILMRLILNTLALALVAWLLPGIHAAGPGTLLVTVLALGVLNLFLRPILMILTLPVNILTLGLFTFIVNGLLLLLASKIVPGFTIDGFWWAVLGALIYSIASHILNGL